jgi:hypothetical protein
MRLTFLGKDTQGGNSPTLWETDDGQYVIQGFTLDAEASGQVGAVPDGEAVIRVPDRPRPGMGSGHSLHPVRRLRRSGISVDHLRRPGPCVPGDSSS